MPADFATATCPHQAGGTSASSPSSTANSKTASAPCATADAPRRPRWPAPQRHVEARRSESANWSARYRPSASSTCATYWRRCGTRARSPLVRVSRGARYVPV